MKMEIRDILVRSKKIRVPGKKMISNYYMNYSDKDKLLFDIYETEKTVLFGFKEGNIYRVFFYTVEPSDLIFLLKQNIQGEEVIEIVSKESLDSYRWIENTGFRWYKTFERYGTTLQSYEETKRNYEKSRMNNFYNENYGQFATMEDIPDIQCCIKNQFDERADHFFCDKDLADLISNKNIYVEKENGHIYCICIFRIEGKKIYFNLSYNMGTADVLYSIERKILLNAICEHKVTYSYCWMDQENVKAQKRRGAPSEHIYNYIFVR